jgi:bifunctional non-homologous end joining protein LigD
VLPQVQGRPATPEAVAGGCGQGIIFRQRPLGGDPAVVGQGADPARIRPEVLSRSIPCFDTPAALAWLGQVAALELHVPQWRVEQPAGPSVTTSRSDERYPDRVVFDLDPGPGAGLAECVDVALALRERLGPLGQRVAVVTSGSKGLHLKGLHLYVPMDDPITSSLRGRCHRPRRPGPRRGRPVQCQRVSPDPGAAHADGRPRPPAGAPAAPDGYQRRRPGPS